MIVAVLLLVVRAAGVVGQSTAAPATTMRLEVDNDLLALRGKGPPADYDYTHGTRIELALPRAPAIVGRAWDRRRGAPTPARSSAVVSCRSSTSDRRSIHRATTNRTRSPEIARMPRGSTPGPAFAD